MDLIFTKGEALKEPFEYFCTGCNNLRLTFVKTNKCFKCGTEITIKGRPNEIRFT